jgi:ribosomal protein L37AE/L43A
MEIHAKTMDRRLEEMMGRYSNIPRTISVGFIYIMDATGRQHELTMNMARSFDQFNKALRILFELGSPQDRLLVKYTNIGAYDLTIDDGREQRQLTNQEEWSNAVQRGTTIVMRVVMVQQTNEKKYKCPFCAFWNWQEEGNGQLIDCCSCKRCFHITTGDLNTAGTNDAVETVLAVPDHERDLISNVHLKEDRRITLYSCHSGYRYSFLLPREDGVSLSEIMREQISSLDYAFLLAGQTSIGDEKVSDEAIHLAAATLAAGYRGIWKKRRMSSTSGGTSGDMDDSEGDGSSAP